MAFVHDLSQAFPDSSAVLRHAAVMNDETVTTRLVTEDENVLASEEPATITHRRGQTKFLEPHEEAGDGKEIPKIGRAAATLCRLAFGLAKAPDIISMADAALTGLFSETQVDAGALLLLPRDFQGEPIGADLEIVNLAHGLRSALSPRLEFSRRHRAPRGRSRARPQRHGR